MSSDRLDVAVEDAAIEQTSRGTKQYATSAEALPSDEGECIPVEAADSEESWPYRLQLVIRKSDQLIVWLLTAVSLAGMVFYFWHRNRIENGLTEIDRAGASRPAVYLVDINLASWPELDNLPGIGAGLAKAIVEYRETRGPYRTLDELQEVDGIGAARLENLRAFLAPIDDSITGSAGPGGDGRESD